jgi:hypothetical protein
MTVHDITRREAIQRVTALLGGITLVGGSGLLAACAKERPPVTQRAAIGEFTVQDIDLLDEIADTILPETSTPGAKAAQTGPFMALMVTDTYKPSDAQVFRAGLGSVDEATRKAHGVTFMAATPAQRLTVIEALDREAKAHGEARDAARKAAKEKPDSAKAPGADVGAANVITADAPTHYFRMMKELAMLGYFTSEIGCTKAMRYIESPGRFDPCVPYQKGDKAWAGHA